MRARSLSVEAKASESMFQAFCAHVDRQAVVVRRLNRARARMWRDLSGVEISDPGHGRGRVVGRDTLFPER